MSCNVLLIHKKEDGYQKFANDLSLLIGCLGQLDCLFDINQGGTLAMCRVETSMTCKELEERLIELGNNVQVSCIKEEECDDIAS